MSSDDGNPFGNVPVMEPVRELRGFPLGTILLRLGLVAEGPINEALAECEQARKPLGRFLVERGALDEADLARALAIQKGLPFVQLEEVTPDPRAVALLSAHTASTLGALPIGYAGVVPVVAVADPTNREVIDEICATIDGEIVIAAASPGKLKEVLVAAYRAVDSPAEVVPLVVAPPPAPVKELEVVFRVVATIGSERVDLAHCRTRASAETRAQQLVAELADGGWLSCENRLVRAESVISIEILETAVTP
jgi:hypothetical protein